MRSRREFVVVDRNGDPVAVPFESERKAYEAMGVYRDHASDIELPMRVIATGLSDDVENDRFVPFDDPQHQETAQVTTTTSREKE